MTFRIAVVQPIAHRPGEDEANVAGRGRPDRARCRARRAFRVPAGDLSGPWRMPATFDPTAAMVEAATRLGVHVIFGTIEPIDEEAATATT